MVSFHKGFKMQEFFTYLKQYSFRILDLPVQTATNSLLHSVSEQLLRIARRSTAEILEVNLEDKVNWKI